MLDVQSGLSDRENGAGVIWSILEFSEDVVRVVIKESVNFGCNKGAEDECLTQVFGMSVEIPRSNSTEVAAVRFLGLQIEVLEDVDYVVPVLHE